MQIVTLTNIPSNGNSTIGSIDVIAVQNKKKHKKFIEKKSGKEISGLGK